MLRERTDRAWFRCLLWHLARKRSGSNLTTPEPTWVNEWNRRKVHTRCRSILTTPAPTWGMCVCVCVSTYHLSTPGTIVQLSETASKILEARHQLLLILCIADPVKIILDLRTKRSAVRSLQVTNDRKGKRRVEAAIWNFNFVSVHNVTMFTVFTVNQQLTIMAWQ